MVDSDKYGFVGLGDMGGPMAANLARGGFQLIVYDKAGTENLAPSGVEVGVGISLLLFVIVSRMTKPHPKQNLSVFFARDSARE